MTGLKKLYVDFDETILHYSEETLEDGLLFEETYSIRGDNGFYDVINAKLLTNSDAHHFTLYEGSVLAPIERMRIMKDIMSMYNKTPKDKLKDMFDEISDASMSASYQSKPGGVEEITEWIKEPFEQIENAK